MEYSTIEDLGIVIDTDGYVYSLVTKRFLTSTPDRYGYARVYMTLPNGKRKGSFVHRLLAMAFIPNHQNKPCVNHKDGNKKNNSIDNLEWCTHKENSSHAVKLGLMSDPLRTKQKILRDAAVFDLKKCGWTHDEISVAMDMTQPNVTRILSRKKLLKVKAHHP